MSNSVAVVVALLVLGGIVAAVVSWRCSSTEQSLATEIGPPAALADYLGRLQRSTAPHAFLIVADPDSGDFVQFSAFPNGIQIDFPVITLRQQELEPRVRQLLESSGLRPESTTRTDGSRFLDANSTASPEEIADVIRSIFREAFGRLPASFNYQSDGLEPHAG